MAPRPIQPSGRGVSSGRSGLMKSSVRSAEAELRVESMLDGHERRHQSRQHHPAQTPGEQLAHQGQKDPVSVFEGRQDRDRRNPRDNQDKEHQELEQSARRAPRRASVKLRAPSTRWTTNWWCTKKRIQDRSSQRPPRLCVSIASAHATNGPGGAEPGFRRIALGTLGSGLRAPWMKVTPSWWIRR
jgi:hypothetical protein